MTQVRIEGKEYAIKQIFSDEFEFNIPRYQRPYSWNAEKAEALLNDLLIASLEDESKPIKDVEPYFLGCIVLIKQSNKSKAAIVDGQQRLTTLTILLSALRASVTKEEADDLVTYLYQKGNKMADTPNRYRLCLRERDEEFFRTFIQDENGIEKLKELNDLDLTDSQKLIKANALLFLNRLQGIQEELSLNLFTDVFDEAALGYSKSISPNQRLRLAQFIIQQCFLVVVSTPTLETAYRIFSVLNDRGFNISLTDILKAEIIGKISEQKQDIYTRKWEEDEEKLGRDNFTEMFSHIRTIRRRAKPNKNILEEFREYVIKPINSSENLIDTVISPCAKAFYKIKKPNDDTNNLPKKIINLFQWLNQIDNFDWLPPAIFYLSKQNSEEYLVEFFTRLERLAAGLMILRANVNERVTRYNKLLNFIDDNRTLFDPYSPLQLSSEEQRKIINNLNGDIYLVEKVRRYVLLRLDYLLSGGGASYTHEVITIEHVLPQNPSANSQWLQLFPTKKDREKYVHRLGNLVLLSRSKNSQAQNWDFEVKKQTYFSKGISPFVLTTNVLHESEWTPSVIERRQEELMNHLKVLWDLQDSEPIKQLSLNI
ncbi:hypothetical protein NIES2101_38470 [Calothrix sp. HK-06]|nr:hypothetical protein NIES2101_38470 [Calothrix sp. HK-06]